MMGAPEGAMESGSGEAGNRTWVPWFTRHRLISYTTADSNGISLCRVEQGWQVRFSASPESLSVEPSGACVIK